MFEKAKEIINSSKDIYIVGHINPDGDSIGSAFALYYSLKELGKNVNVIIKKHSDSFSFLPGIENIVDHVDKNEYDLLICVDSSQKSRLDISDEDFNKAKHTILIDHHRKAETEDNNYCNLCFVDVNLPAACQIVYNFIKKLNLPFNINSATYIYTGLMTDTGSFNYSSTTPETLRIAADLVEMGVDFAGICQKLNDTIKEEKLRLIAYSIDNMESIFDGKVRYVYVSYEKIKSLNLDEEDAEGVTNYLRKVKGTEVAIYVRGRSDGTNKVSLRSAGLVDVSKIAISFGGGGHQRAAGYTMYEEINVEKERLLNMIEVMLK